LLFIEDILVFIVHIDLFLELLSCWGWVVIQH